jgi:hypothetical protein
MANSRKRVFPKEGIEIRPENINGGYTYPCNPETIMIYRAEDATRVLIHELQHSCCLDDMKLGVDQTEAETEAWAELLYIGFLSRGNKLKLNELLLKQSNWMIKQNRKVRKYIRNTEFPWRYTIGKEEVWRRWNILCKEKKSICNNEETLRLTCIPSDEDKKYFKVRKESIIL